MKRTGIVLLLLLVFYDGFSSIGKKQVRLRLQDTISNLLDETDVYLDLGISPAFIAVEDAQKKYEDDVNIPQFYSLTTNGVECFSNGYGAFSSSVAINLGYRVLGGSVYAISAKLIDNFEPTTIIQIEDKATGQFHDLRQGPYIITINQAEQGNTRFVLHISYPPIIIPVASGCNNDDGAISILQDTSILWTSCQLYDGSMNYLSAYNGIKGNFSFSNLVEGDYNLAFVYGIYSSVIPIRINGKQIIAGINVPNTNVAVGDTIPFYSDARNATHFAWDFGDSTRIEGVANPEAIYTEPGTYVVQLKCTNDQGCVAYAYVTIYVSQPTGIDNVWDSPVKIFAWQKQLRVLTNQHMKNYRLEIYNTAGQLVKYDTVTGNYVTSLAEYAAGIYIVRLSSAERTFTQKIVIE